MQTVTRALFPTLLLCLSGCVSIQKMRVTHPPDYAVIHRGYFLGDPECPGTLLRSGYSSNPVKIVIACPDDGDLDRLMKDTARKMSEVGAVVSASQSSLASNLRFFEWKLPFAKPNGADDFYSAVDGDADFQRVSYPLGLTIITIRAFPHSGASAAAFASIGYNLLFPKDR